VRGKSSLGGGDKRRTQGEEPYATLFEQIDQKKAKKNLENKGTPAGGPHPRWKQIREPQESSSPVRTTQDPPDRVRK